MSESEKTVTELPPQESQSQSDEVTIVVSEQEEPDISTKVTKDSDPIWREIRGLRRQVALANRRQSKHAKPQQIIAVQSSATEVTQSALEQTTEKTTVTEVGNRASKPPKRTSPFDSMFRKWR